MSYILDEHKIFYDMPLEQTQQIQSSRQKKIIVASEMILFIFFYL